jgi:hypothetical protein
MREFVGGRVEIDIEAGAPVVAQVRDECAAEGGLVGEGQISGGGA